MIELDISAFVDGGSSARLEVAGEIDRDTAGQLVQAVEKVAGGGDRASVQVDFSGVTFLDSAGIRAVLTARRIASEHGAALYLTDVRGNVLDVLTIMGLLDILSSPPPPKGRTPARGS